MSLGVGGQEIMLMVAWQWRVETVERQFAEFVHLQSFHCW